MELRLIGAVRWGKRYRMTAAPLPGVDIAHLASRNPASAALVPPGCGIPPDSRELIADGSLAAVTLACPSTTHAEIAHTALARRRPVLMENPMTLTLRDAQAVAAAAAGTVVFTRHTHLSDPAFPALETAVAGVGPLRGILSMGDSRRPVRPDASVLWDHGPHDVVTNLHHFGASQTSVTAACADRQHLSDVQGEVIEIRIGLPGGATAEIPIGNATAEEFRVFTACRPGGRLGFDYLAAQPLARRRRAPGAETPIAMERELPPTVPGRKFCSAIAAGAAPHPSIDVGVHLEIVPAECEHQLATVAGATGCV